MTSREGEISLPRGAVLFCTAAARLASHLSVVTLRRTGAFVLDTGTELRTRVVLTIPSSSSCELIPTVDVFDGGGFLRSHELDVAGARLVYAVLTRAQSRLTKRPPMLVGDALLALARWHDERAKVSLRILTHRVGSTADEVTKTERAPTSATTAMSSAG